VRSGTIKKRESIVPETIKKRLESYPGWSDLVRLRKKNGPNAKDRSLGVGRDISKDITDQTIKLTI